MDVTLVMSLDSGAQKAFEIGPGQTSIGRRDECDLRIPLGEVSRKHAIVIVSDDSVTIRDLGSANGTYVNNQKISEQELEAGDHIVIGPIVFTVQINGEPQDIKPVHTKLESRRTLSETAAMTSGEEAKKKSDQKPPPIKEDDLFGDEDDDDPISALEALAASDETAAIDLDDWADEDESRT
jgi:pSer/pThr/pTyr-binding forkhead associated (FHA) protein